MANTSSFRYLSPVKKDGGFHYGGRFLYSRIIPRREVCTKTFMVDAANMALFESMAYDNGFMWHEQLRRLIDAFCIGQVTDEPLVDGNR